MGDKKTTYGIFALDGTPILIRVYDAELNRTVEAYRFVSVQVAQEALDLVDHDYIDSCGGVIIRAIVEA